MTDPDFLNPPIEVLANSPRLDMIKSRLKSAGLRPYDARNDMGNMDPLLIDAKSVNGLQLQQIKRQIARQSQRVMILLAAPGAPLLQDAIIITHTSELASIPARLEVARRKQDRLQEVRLRARTAAEIAGGHVKCVSDDPASILFLGNGSSRFLALQAGLRSLGVSVTAALTALTARDYLAQRNFSCVLVDIDEGANSATEFLKHFTADQLREAVPVLAMVRAGTDRSLDQQAILANATEIINADLPLMDVADNVSMLSEYHKAATPMTPDLTNDGRIHDRMTGLFTADYLKLHLQNQINNAPEQPAPLSFMTLQLASPIDGNTAARKALPLLAKYLLADLRQTDCAGRLDWATIGVSLRNTSYSGGVRLAQRLVEKLGGPVLPALNISLGHGGSLSWRIIEKRRYHTAADLFQAGIKGPQTRIMNAA